MKLALILLGLVIFTGQGALCGAAAAREHAADSFPPSLESYNDSHMTSLTDILVHRVKVQPFNLWATLLFLGAIIHTFLTHKFRSIAHDMEDRLKARSAAAGEGEAVRQVSSSARFFHFMGEVEAVFGIWAIPLLILMVLTIGQSEAEFYVNERVNYTEAIFVVVIMAIASTRPILELTERILSLFARLGGGTPRAWWVVILSVGPLLGSFITEPAAMTLCALLLTRKFYALKPGKHLAYGTLGLLFVNVSIGGTLTHFAAPPVLMVAGAWSWDLMFMLGNFGWKAALSIGISVLGYFTVFYKELKQMEGASAIRGGGELPIPYWVTAGHLFFLVLAVFQAHHSFLLVLVMMFFLAFVEVTEDFQSNFQLRPPVLVGFFLAGLVIHGGLQQWWIAPVLGKLGELPLMLGATFLTAFNDNAAITYLCTLVPSFTDGMKYAAVAGAVSGGGLTVIANAPNPAGQSILNDHFEDGISASGLALGALAPTVVALLVFFLIR